MPILSMDVLGGRLALIFKYYNYNEVGDAKIEFYGGNQLDVDVTLQVNVNNEEIGFYTVLFGFNNNEKRALMLNMFATQNIRRITTTIKGMKEVIDFDQNHETAPTYKAMFDAISAETGEKYYGDGSGSIVNPLESVLSALNKGYNINIRMTCQKFKNGSFGSEEYVYFNPNFPVYSGNMFSIRPANNEWEASGTDCYAVKTNALEGIVFEVRNDKKISMVDFEFNTTYMSLSLSFASAGEKNSLSYVIKSFDVISPIGEQLVNNSTDQNLLRQICTAIYNRYPEKDYNNM